jgi:hypothetical protein
MTVGVIEVEKDPSGGPGLGCYNKFLYDVGSTGHFVFHEKGNREVWGK